MSRSILPEEKQHLRSVMDRIKASPKPLGPDLAADALRWMSEATLFHVTPSPDACDHEWGGWRNFEDGNGGEQVCKKCGMGAMAHTLMTGP